MNSNNAQQFLTQAANNIPPLKQVMNIIANGGNPKAIFEILARQMNADPNLILNKLLN